MKRLLVLSVLAFITACLMAAASSAAPSGGTVSVSPSAPVVGDSLVFTGCGWNATNPNGTQNTVSLQIQQPDLSYVGVGAMVAKSGCFTTEAISYLAMQTGRYSVLVFQKYRQASLDFTVG